MALSPTNKRLCLSAATMLAVIVIDQIIKVYVKTHFLLHESVDVTPWFKLVFIENRGMAFGMDFIGTAVLTVFRIAAIIFFCYILRKAAKGLKPFGLILCIALIIAGAAGNIIDNCLYGLIFTESLPYVPSIPPSARATAVSSRGAWWICSTFHSSPGLTGCLLWAATCSSARFSTLPMPPFLAVP